MGRPKKNKDEKKEAPGLVDLVMKDTLKPRIRENVLKEAIPI